MSGTAWSQRDGALQAACNTGGSTTCVSMRGENSDRRSARRDIITPAEAGSFDGSTSNSLKVATAPEWK